MRSLIFVCLLCLSQLTLWSSLTCEAGQGRTFPYQARVVVDELFARSGAGESWLPTQRLTRDAIVTVHRHDPGGWFQIEPPDGAFSWVPERHVRRLSESEGEVIENNSVAFVGSDFGDDTTVWQRRLQQGERLKIIDRKELQTLSGKKVMYKISPPRREFRWVQGSGLVPVDEERRRQLDHDPYQVPSNAVRPSEATAGGRAAGDGVTDLPPVVTPGSQLARLQQLRREQEQLAAIDQRFRDMVLREPSGWNLDEIEDAYRELQRASYHKPIAGQIDLRYPAIERYRRRLTEYQDLRRLTSQTESRDAQLLARTTRRPATSNALPPAVRSVPSPRDSLAQVSELTSPVAESVAPPTDTAPLPFSGEFSGQVTDQDSSMIQPASFSLTTSGDAEPVRSTYVGAGVVQRSHGEKSDALFVLATPAGRILAYLKPAADLDFARFVGHQVGVHGSRGFRNDLDADLIDVTGLEPVRLR